MPCTNVGFQLGGSYGLYDWVGRGSAPSSKEKKLQQQLFVTTGFFGKEICESGFNVGLVYDWMWNKGFGVFGLQTSFSQLRMQAGYLLCCKNEYGLWATIDLNRAHESSEGIPVTYRSLAQANAYWTHYFDNGAETMVWAGAPYKRSLSFSTGRAGKFIIGASFHTPLTDRISIDGHASYMAPHSARGSLTQRYYGANVALELKYSFGDCCSNDTPYMQKADNSNFMTDTNVTF